MKISIIGAGNVGAHAAMHIVQSGLGNVVLVDVAVGIAKGKALDLEDSAAVLKYNYNIQGTEDMGKIADSDVVVVSAGFARKPGMTREELVNVNARIVKEICLNIKKFAPASILIMVTNPLDLMTYLALKATGFAKGKVMGMGITLDAARFSNLISKGLNVPNTVIETKVIGSHGEGMLPLTRFTYVKGEPLSTLLDDKTAQALAKRTKERGQEIVSFLGSGSAYFAPSLAIKELVRCIVKDTKEVFGVSTYLEGEYGTKDVCIGVPCSIGKQGVEKIVGLDLNKEEKEAFISSAESLRLQISKLPL